MNLTNANIILIIISASLLSSLLTAFMTSFFLRRLYRTRLKANIDKQVKQIGIEVENGVKRAAEGIIPTIRNKVREGVIDGVNDVSKSTGQITSNAIRHGLENFDPFQIFSGDYPRKSK